MAYHRSINDEHKINPPKKNPEFDFAFDTGPPSETRGSRLQIYFCDAGCIVAPPTFDIRTTAVGQRLRWILSELPRIWCRPYAPFLPTCTRCLSEFLKTMQRGEIQINVHACKGGSAERSRGKFRTRTALPFRSMDVSRE